MYGIAPQVIFGRTGRSIKMNNDFIAIQMHKARLDDLLRQAGEDRLCRRLRGEGEIRRSRQYKMRAPISGRNRIFPETNYSGSGVSQI
jgi:hypothetical protein